jgi:hypothetical protein
MSQTTKTLTLDKVRQLVDLNGELTNFVARFIITPKTDTPYEYTIASQTMLDNAESLNFLPAKGPVQKEFSIEEDLYQNHFLVLRSTAPHEVDVIIQREPLPSKVIPNAAATAQAVTIPPPPPTEPPFYKQLWFQLLILCVVIGVSYYLYNKYFSKKTEASSVPVPEPKKYSFASSAPRYLPVVLSSSEKTETVVDPSPIVPVVAPAPVVPMPSVEPVVACPAPPVVEAVQPSVAPVAAEPVISAPKASSPKDFTSMLLKKLKTAQQSSR